MGQYTSYWLYQRFEQRGSQDPIPTYPNVYSVDADGTMPLVVRNEDDTECGYVPPVEPTYRWINIPITQDFICDECGIAQYRWVNMDSSVDYYCEGTTKYYKQKKQVSYDGGQTWIDVSPAEYQKGGVAEQRSTDCGYVPPTPQYRWIKSDDTICVEPQYRWINMDASVDYYCEGTTKYYKQKKQISLDDGQTWQDVSPAEYQKGDVAETESTDCGYVPPIPTNKKFVYTAFGNVYETECNGDGTLTNGEVFKDDSIARYMTSAIIGDCVTVIGDEALAPNGPDILTSLTIGNNVTTIGRRAFAYRSGFTSVVLPDSVTTIGRGAFASCRKLTNVNIPRGVTFIGDSAFNSCSGLTSSIDIPNGVTELYGGTFANCYNLTSVHLPSGLTKIGGQEFQGCSLTSITIPNSVIEIGHNAFRGCNFTNLTIPNSVTKIGQNAFTGCHELTSCTIGSGVISIGSEAFGSCSGLTSLTINAITPPTLRTDVFWNTNSCPIYVPSQSVSAYKSAENWSAYASRIQAIP